MRKFCDGIRRRDFLKIGALGMGGLSLPQLLAAEGGKSNGKAAIMIYLAGGAPHIDMWDMKPDAPMEIRGEFNPMATAVPGIQICELFPQVARRMDQFTIVRSLEGMVDRHESNQCLSGYTGLQQQQAQYPCLGSAATKLLGPQDASVPPFMTLSAQTQHRPWGNGGEPGFLGAAYSPFRPDGEGLDNMKLTIPSAALQDRRLLLAQFDRFRADSDATGQAAGVDAFNQRALDVLTSNRLLKALDPRTIDDETRERYGSNSRSPVDDGPPADPLDLLTAYRLIEAGVRVVTVAWCRWDWHGGNFTQGRKYMPMLDRALAALVDDLTNSGRIDDVSIIVWGEFGRTPRINGTAGRDHFPSANTALLAGGGMRTGQVIGATDRTGSQPTASPIHMQRVLATIYQLMGIDPQTATITDPRGRPQYLVENRTPVKELVG